MTWYEELVKPAWAPPAPVFGIVWSILYPIIIAAYGYVIYRMLDIIIVLVTIVWSMIAIWPHARWASLALTPYLVWVMIATALQSSITWLNR